MLNGKAGGVPDNGIDPALRTHRCLAGAVFVLVDPFVDGLRRKGLTAVEAPTNIALENFSSMPTRMSMRISHVGRKRCHSRSMVIFPAHYSSAQLLLE